MLLLGMAWAINYDFTAAVAAYNGPVQSWSYQQVMDQELLVPFQPLLPVTDGFWGRVVHSPKSPPGSKGYHLTYVHIDDPNQTQSLQSQN